MEQFADSKWRVAPVARRAFRIVRLFHALLSRAVVVFDVGGMRIRGRLLGGRRTGKYVRSSIPPRKIRQRRTANPGQFLQMLTKRIIACLDVDAGRVVKGTQFLDLRDAGDPADLAAAHSAAGADEVVLLDITATHQKRATLLDTVRRTAHELFVPFTVGGGVRTLTDAGAIFDAGADKVSINSAAIAEPELITCIGQRFGSQAVIVAIDAKRSGTGFEAYSSGGRVPAGKDAIGW